MKSTVIKVSAPEPFFLSNRCISDDLARKSAFDND